MEEVFAYIDANKDRYVAELQHLIRQPSVSFDFDDCRKAAELLREQMVNSGIEDTILFELPKFPPVVFGKLYSKNPNTRTMIAYDHYDVKPVEPLDEWHHDPWGADIDENGIMWGRGAVDDKSGCLAFVFATEAFLKTRGDVPVNVLYTFEGTEETGSQGLDYFILQNKELFSNADGLHCLDGGRDSFSGKISIQLYCKGILAVELRAKGADIDQHSLNAHVAPNPLWRLAWALSSIKNEKEEILIDGWYDEWLDPEDSEEAMNYLKQDLEKFDEADLRQRLGINEFPAGRSGLELLKAKRLFPTATINGMSGGWVKEGHNTIIPATAFAKLDFRLAPNMHPNKQFERLKQHLKAKGFGDIEVIRVDDGSIPWYTPPSEAICQSLIRAAEKVYGETPTVVTPTAEHEFYHLAGVQCALTGFGGRQPNLHGPNENISVEDYIKGIKYAAQIMIEFSK